MILDIPSRGDFEEQGLTLLNLAWDTVTELLLEYRDAKEWDAIVEDEQTEHYQRASQKPLAIATALLQQGSEFLVKAAIAEVSPLLLIAGTSQLWPKRCDTEDVQFSAFRTPDAEDLIRIHNTVAQRRFSEAFVQRFGEMRKIRNTVFHSVNRNLRFTEREILSAILEVTTELFGPNKWMHHRDKYLGSTPSAAFATEGHGFVLVREFGLLVELLGNSDLKTHFGFDKKQRRYLCPECEMACREYFPDLKPRTAHLRPNSPSSLEVHCVVCRVTIPVSREPCPRAACRGNVISLDQECLTCGEFLEAESN